MQATEVKVDNHMKQELPADENTPIPVVFSHDDPANPQAWASSKRWRGELLPALLSVGSDEWLKLCLIQHFSSR